MWKRNILVATCVHPDQESHPQPRYVLWLRIEPAVFWCMGWCSNQLSHPSRALFTFLKNILFIFREKGREEERERNIDVQEKHRRVASGTHPHVETWPGIEPVSFLFVGQWPSHWATTARDGPSSFFNALLDILFCEVLVHDFCPFFYWLEVFFLLICVGVVKKYFNDNPFVTYVQYYKYISFSLWHILWCIPYHVKES